MRRSRGRDRNRRGERRRVTPRRNGTSVQAHPGSSAASKNGVVTRGNVWYFRPRQLAFPEAEGYGRFAIGGRGGVVVHVTNLDDSGPGSVRDAIETDRGPRTVVFDGNGFTDLDEYLEWMSLPHFFTSTGKPISVDLGQAFVGYTASPSNSSSVASSSPCLEATWFQATASPGPSSSTPWPPP